MRSSKINFSSREQFYSCMNRINDKAINSSSTKGVSEGDGEVCSIYDIYKNNKQKIIEDKLCLKNTHRDLSLSRTAQSSISGFFNFKSNLKRSGIVSRSSILEEKSESKPKSSNPSKIPFTQQANELCINNQTYFYRKASYVYHSNKLNKLPKDKSTNHVYSQKSSKKYFDVNANKNFYFPTGIFANRKNISKEVEFKERTNQKYLLINEN